LNGLLGVSESVILDVPLSELRNALTLIKEETALGEVVVVSVDKQLNG
jgi:hypothetical protein